MVAVFLFGLILLLDIWFFETLTKGKISFQTIHSERIHYAWLIFLMIALFCQPETVLVLIGGAIIFYLTLRSEFLKKIYQQYDSGEVLVQKIKMVEQGYGVVLKFIFCLVSVEFALTFLKSVTPWLDSSLVQALLATFLTSLLGIFFVYRAVQNLTNENIWEYLKLKEENWSRRKNWLVGIFLGAYCSFCSVSVVLSRDVQPETPMSQLLEQSQSVLTMLGFLGLAILFAPFFEELVFRGFFYRVISFLGNRWLAMVSVAVSFGLLHVGQYWTDWEAISVVFILGFLLSLLRMLSGSLVPSVVMHYTYNLMVVLWPVILNAFGVVSLEHLTAF